MSYNTIVFQSGSTYYAKDNLGGTLYAGTDACTAIQTGLDRAGILLIQQGTYPITQSLAVRSDSHVTLDPLAYLQVTQGAFGTVWYFDDSVERSCIEGGKIYELGTPARNWYGVMLQSTVAGITNNIVRNMTIVNPYTGVLLWIDGEPGWINGNVFAGLKIHSPRIGIGFSMSVAYDPTGVGGSTGMRRNVFRDIGVWANSAIEYGVREVRHANNMFINVSVLGMTSGTASTTIHADAEDTLILGGAMTYYGFYDNGIRSNVIDPSQSARFGQNSQVLIGTAALPTSTTTGFCYVSNMDGVPTGIPVSHTGTAPVTVMQDAANTRLYIRDVATGTWKYLTLT